MIPASWLAGLIASALLILLAGVLYFLTRRAAWLAGTRVSSLLALCGLTLLWSMGVPGNSRLTFMWVAAIILGVAHLVAAAAEHRARGAYAGSFESGAAGFLDPEPPVPYPGEADPTAQRELLI